jgi:hypothetical protein
MTAVKEKINEAIKSTNAGIELKSAPLPIAMR